jgi:hypothetical protein
VADAWFQKVHAPEKICLIEGSAHMVMQEEPERFLYHLASVIALVLYLFHAGLCKRFSQHHEFRVA